MKNKLIIIGAGGHGKVVLDAALKMKQWEVIHFLDDDINKQILKFDIIGKVEDAFKYKEEYDFFVAIGDNKKRKLVLENLMSMKSSIVTIIHPNTSLGMNVLIGDGCFVASGVVINPFTNIGEGCILNTSCSIDHDNSIGKYAHIAPGVRLAGFVNIGENCFLGIGSVVINNIEICDDCIIGANSLVIKSIIKTGIYKGSPIKNL